MAASNEDLESRISRLEKDKENRFRFFIQYLLSPILVLAIGITFNWKLEKDKKIMNQLQIAQSMLVTLFSDDEFKSLATKRLMDEVIDNPNLKSEIGKIVEDYLNNKFKKSVKKGDLETANNIFEAAKSTGGTAGESIVRSIESNKENTEALSKYQQAVQYEKDGFGALARDDFKLSLDNFRKAYEIYPDFHMTDEIYHLLNMNKEHFDNIDTQRKIYRDIVEKYSWNAPQDIIKGLKSKLSSK